MLDDERDRSISDVILQQYLTHSKAQEKPVAIITAGERNAGRLIIAEAAKDQLSHSGGFVKIDHEELASYHPDYFSIADKNGIREAHKAVSPESKKWAGNLLEAAMEGRKNIVIDQSSKNPDSVEQLTQVLHKEGYQVELRIMATPEHVANYREEAVNEHSLMATGIADIKTQLERYEERRGINATVAAVEDKKLVDAISVYDRDGNLAYSNTLDANKTWFKEPEAAKTLDFENTKPLRATEADYYQQQWTHLIEMKLARGAPQEEINIARQEMTGNRESDQTKLEGLAKSNADIERLGKDRNLMVRDSETVQGNIDGTLIGQTEHHMLVQVSPVLAVKYDKAAMAEQEHELEIGQQIQIQQTQHHDLILENQRDQQKQRELEPGDER